MERALCFRLLQGLLLGSGRSYSSAQPIQPANAHNQHEGHAGQQAAPDGRPDRIV